MAKDNPPSPLAVTAGALDTEIERFESLTRQLEEAPLSSEKQLERAAKMLTDLGECEERLHGHVMSLAKQLTGVRDRQQVHAKAVTDRAQVLQQRTVVFQELMQQFAALGQSAAELNGRVQRVAALRQAGASQEDTQREVLGLIAELQVRMGDVAGEAQALTDAANEKDFPDIARQADSLRQQLLSARNKMGLLEKALRGEA